MDLTQKEVVLEKMIEWEYEHGETILDGRFGSDIKLTTFMAWAVGAKYITHEKFNKWIEAYNNNEYQADEIGLFLYDGHDDEVSEYAIVNSKDGEWHEDECYEGYAIIAHFVSDFTIYQKRFKLFLEEGVW